MCVFNKDKKFIFFLRSTCCTEFVLRKYELCLYCEAFASDKAGLFALNKMSQSLHCPDE